MSMKPMTTLALLPECDTAMVQCLQEPMGLGAQCLLQPAMQSLQCLLQPAVEAAGTVVELAQPHRLYIAACAQ